MFVQSEGWEKEVMALRLNATAYKNSGVYQRRQGKGYTNIYKSGKAFMMIPVKRKGLEAEKKDKLGICVNGKKNSVKVSRQREKYYSRWGQKTRKNRNTSPKKLGF